MPDYNVTLWKQIADEQGIDYSGYSPASLRYEETWIRIVGGNAVGEALDDGVFTPSQDYLIQQQVDNMPDKESLAGLWFLGYDSTNQIVKDWSGNGNNGLRGNSETINTSSPEGINFDGADVVQVAYAANMATLAKGDVSFGVKVGSIPADTTSTFAFSQNSNNRAFLKSFSQFGARMSVPYAKTIFNTPIAEHYMATGDGVNDAVYLYRDGILVDSVSDINYNVDANNQSLLIGDSNASFTSPFLGTIHCAYLYTSNQSANAALINTTINNILTILEDQNV